MGAGRSGRQHRHAASDALAVLAVIGLAFGALSLVMLARGAGSPWHGLAIVVGLPSALLAAFVCLRRGWEDTD